MSLAMQTSVELQEQLVTDIKSVISDAEAVLSALAAAVVLQVQNASKLVELIYYVVAGLLWVLPAGFVIKWMQQPDA